MLCVDPKRVNQSRIRNKMTRPDEIKTWLNTFQLQNKIVPLKSADRSSAYAVRKATNVTPNRICIVMFLPHKIKSNTDHNDDQR